MRILLYFEFCSASWMYKIQNRVKSLPVKGDPLAVTPLVYIDYTVVAVTATRSD